MADRGRRAPRTSCCTTAWEGWRGIAGCGVLCAAAWARFQRPWPHRRAPRAPKFAPTQPWPGCWCAPAARKGLLEERDLDADFVAAIRHYRIEGTSCKINLALNGLPEFTAYPNSGYPGAAGPHHRATMHICPSIDYVERAWDDAKYGRASERPLLELTIPTIYDPSLAPPGKHIMGIFLQYAPYRLREGTWDELREPFGDRVISLIEEYVPNIRQIVEHRQVLSPLDLERRFGITGGNIFHGEMSLDQMFVMRPVAGWARYRTPVQGLFLCGSGAHPGGGVMGAPGFNCAREMLKRG
jgi:phytoene dehydrogenase-like protein